MTQQNHTDAGVSNNPERPSATVRTLSVVPPPHTDQLAEVDGSTPIVVGLAPEGHVYLVLPPGEVVTGTMAVAAAVEVERLGGDRKLQMLLVLSGVEAVTKGARKVFSAADMAAVAVLGVSPVDRVIANFLLGGAVQPCPTRYFSTEPEALAWLKRKRTVA